MKKPTKLLLFTAGTLGAAALVNHWIFKTAGTAPRSRFESLLYRWRHGRIRYVAVGKGEPVVVVHGLYAGASLLEWEEQIALLSKNYRVYGIDLLGFGASDKPNLSYSAYLYASLLNDFIRDVIGSPVNIAAASDGASVAVAACALKPELYSKLLLISPMGVGTTDQVVTPMRRFLQRLIELPVVGTTVYNALCSRAYLCYTLKRNHVSPELADRLYHSAHAGGVGNKYPAAARLSNLLRVRLRVMTHALDLPVMVCWGMQNPSNTLSNFALLRSWNDNIQLTVFNRSGLMPHRSQPKKFYRLCKDFFAG